MVRRVIEGQVGMFDAPEKVSQGTCPPDSRVLTLAEVEGLEPCRSVVWIETRPWATQRVTKESEIYRFFLLFEALFLIFGAPNDGGRRRYHFRYTYSNGQDYDYHRVDEFYGQEWRVWSDRPTVEQMEAEPWKDRQTEKE